jgi:hypothetical protein
VFCLLQHLNIAISLSLVSLYITASLIQILQLHTASLALTQILHLTHSHSNPPPHCITVIHSNHPASFTRIPSTVCCAGPNVDAIATAVASAMAEQKRGSPLFIDVEPYHLDPSLFKLTADHPMTFLAIISRETNQFTTLLRSIFVCLFCAIKLDISLTYRPFLLDTLRRAVLMCECVCLKRTDTEFRGDDELIKGILFFYQKLPISLSRGI